MPRWAWALGLFAPLLWGQQFVTSPQEAALEVYFAGETEGSAALAARVLEWVGGAERSLWMLAYTLSDADLLAALRAHADNPDFDLRILMDGHQFETLTEDAEDAEAQQLLWLHEAGRLALLELEEGRQHAKLMLIDDGLLVAGSKNWSDLDGTNKWNDLVGLYDRKGGLIKAMRSAFEELSAHAGFPRAPRFKKNRLAPDTTEELLAALAINAPGDEAPVRNELLGLVRLAETRIELAMFSINDPELIEVLWQRSQEEELRLRILLDKVQYKNLSYRKDKEALTLRGQLEDLLARDQLRLVSGKQLHHKFALIDDLVATGSANWTKSGWNKNCEAMFLLLPPKRGEPQFPALYAAQHAVIWDACAP